MPETRERDQIKKRANLCGTQLRTLRDAQHHSIVDFRETLQTRYGLTFTEMDLLQIERGERPITENELVAFACFFQVSLEQLVWGETPPDQTHVREMMKTVLLKPEP